MNGWAARALFTALAPSGARGRLSTLIFHRVLPAPDPLFPGEVDVPRFDALCRWLASTFHVLPLADALQRLRERRLPSRAVAITFDDGYADNHDHALPVLARHGLNATFFVTTGMLDGGCMWNDRVIEAIRGCRAGRLDLSGIGPQPLGSHDLGDATRRRTVVDAVIGSIKYLPPTERDAVSRAVAERAGVEAPRDLMMNWDQVRGLHGAGMHVGAHTVSHPILRAMPEGLARAEIADSRRALQAALRDPVPLFAYPNGKPHEDYDARSVSLVKEAGFSAAVTTGSGVADGHTDPYQIPRYTPWDTRPARATLLMARNFRQAPRAI